MSIKYTVMKQLDGGTNVVFEGEVLSVEEALADVAKLNAGEVIRNEVSSLKDHTPTNVDDTTSTKPNYKVKVGDRIEIVHPDDSRYWKGSTGVVGDVLRSTGGIHVKFDKGSYNHTLTDGRCVLVWDYEYKVIS